MSTAARRQSARLFARAKKILPGGVDSPVRAFSTVGGAPPFIRRGRGARIEDDDGGSYVDFVMSWGPLIHGHAPAGLTRVLAAAAKQGTSFGAPTAAEVKLGTTVRRLMPSLERVRFGIGGRLAASPLPHHRAYGSVPRRFGRVSSQGRSRGGNPSEAKNAPGSG